MSFYESFVHCICTAQTTTVRVLHPHYIDLNLDPLVFDCLPTASEQGVVGQSWPQGNSSKNSSFLKAPIVVLAFHFCSEAHALLMLL